MEEAAAEDSVLAPPENFAMVAPGIYRSAFPKKKNFNFLLRLGLKAVLCLVPEDMPEALQDFYEKHAVEFCRFGVPGNKEPFVDIPEKKIAEALSTLLDARHYPILVHCNKGKHRTGCLIGCLRKTQGWSHSAICDEYQRFSAPKARALDQQFIELFDVSGVLVDDRHTPHWLEI